MPLIGLRKLRHGWPIKMTSDSSNNVLKSEISKIMKSDSLQSYSEVLQ